MQELCQALRAIIHSMILVTGGTGFIGQALIQYLVDAGHQVRTLIRPSPRSPRLPLGVPVEVAVASLLDERGLRAAMIGVDVVYHLAGVERRGAKADLMETDIQGTQSVVRAAQDADVKRIFYISHLGADRASAYPVLKAKAIAKEYIRRSGIDFTIMRTAMVFGPGDGFTTGLAQLLKALPIGILLPGDGDVQIQPLWVNDLVTCLVWGLDDDDTRNKIFDLGGPEYLSFREIVEIIKLELDIQRTMIPVSPPYLRAMTVFFEYLLPRPPVSVYWLDYFATNRTCALDTIPRVFNLMPARFSQRLDFLQAQNWRRVFWRSVMGR
ncbi:MAG: NAD-dependent epimerase/dehydratase family protein [Chloroflexi bacterium]|nr:NAD-dependent epimerase/dehydratase family protein [Chloroflexota bacterium]